MYEYISGTISSLEPTQAVVDCCGVGYLLEISLNTYEKLQQQSAEKVKLLVHEVIREDAHMLYGFADSDERQMFRLLIGVNGVGVQTARVMLSSLSVADISAAIADQNVKTIQKVKGIGAKTAQRIVIELADKVGAVRSNIGLNQSQTRSNHVQEAESALVMLGFPKAAVDKVLSSNTWHTADNTPMTVEEIIKQALRLL